MRETAPLHRSGRDIVLQIPLGIEAVKQHKKVLLYLHAFQQEKRSIKWPSPNNVKELNILLKKYQRDLVYDKIHTNVNRAARCVLRGFYNPGEFIKILRTLWISNQRNGLRERFTISVHHHMLLRDQDIRNLNFGDCFVDIIPQQQEQGIQQAVALVFCMDKGKNLPRRWSEVCMCLVPWKHLQMPYQCICILSF